jgi:hypothetical protein
MTRGQNIMNTRQLRPATFSIANRAEDIETLNAILARLRQRFHAKPSRESYERVNAAYQAGITVPALFAVVVHDIETLEERYKGSLLSGATNLRSRRSIRAD